MSIACTNVISNVISGSNKVSYLGVHLERQHDFGGAIPPRCNVFSHDSNLFASGNTRLHAPRQAKVANLEITVRVKQQVGRLEVAVNNASAVY